MEERDARDEARSQQHETQVSRSAPLPSMHAPHLATQHQQRHHNLSSYSQPPQSQYAPSPAQHHNHFYDQRDTHHVPSQPPQQQYDYRSTATPSVSLPPIQHFDAPTVVPAPASTTSNMSGQSTGPSPAPHHPPLPQHPYAHANGDAQNYYQHYSQMPPMYHNPGQYQPYANGMHHPPPPPAMMPSNAPNGQMRYLPPNAQLDPRQMSGGRHKKEIKRRTKTGCLTCRKRRIKCDEEHPYCRNCAKSKRECLGYDPVFKSQPAPVHLQPAPDQAMHRGKVESGYAGYQYPVGEYMQQQPMQHPPPVNSNHADHSAAPLTNGDHNRGPMQGPPVDAQKGMSSVPRT